MGWQFLRGLDVSTSVAIQIAQFRGAVETPAAERLAQLIDRQLDILPLPGSGKTLERWQALAAVAETDLSLAKLYEGHTDALAILSELEGQEAVSSKCAWGVWAAEAPGGRAVFEAHDGGEHRQGSVVIRGSKFWCSGAASVQAALLTAWNADGQGPYLIRLELDQPSIVIQNDQWKAVGMNGSASLNVLLDGAAGFLVGREGQYLSRPGFWQGGAGVAACWYGGAVSLASTLRRGVAGMDSGKRSGFVLAALGKVDLALHETALVLRQAAAWIDAHPTANAAPFALRCRLSAEKTARLVLDEVGRALGATPFCRDRQFAKMAADLPVFIRQSHAEKDLAAVGEHVLSESAPPWSL